MTSDAVTPLLQILSGRLEEIRVTYPVEQVYAAFPSEVRARTALLSLEQERDLRIGAEALLSDAGL